MDTKQNRQQIRLLLTPLEAARALCISERNLWQLTKDGEIESVRVGKRSIRYSSSRWKSGLRNKKKVLDVSVLQ